MIKLNDGVIVNDMTSIVYFFYISSLCVFINTVFCPCQLFLLWNVVLKCLVLCLITIIYRCSLPSPVVLASPAHLYMPHLFTHFLPTIICVMLMFFFLCIFSYFCDMLHFFVIHMFCIFFFWAYVRPHFWFVFQIYLLVFLLFVMQSACCLYIIYVLLFGCTYPFS